MPDVQWLDEPEDHDYDAAQDYLELIVTKTTAAELALALKEHGADVYRKAKDILRASGLPLLPHDNPSVHHDLAKMRNQKPVSPILLIVDLEARTLVIADGYHRACAAYWHSENTEVPARIITMSSRRSRLMQDPKSQE
jgi:hypothetical protein